MERRGFLRHVGMGSVALVSLSSLVHDLRTSASATDQVNFHFVVNSRAPLLGAVLPNIGITGDGKITGPTVVGGGSFNISDTNSAVPRTLLSFGTWKAKRLVSFNLIGTYGAFAAGILEMQVDLVPEGQAVTPATLKQVCNIAAAGLFTGQDEGVTVSIPSASFGTFRPLNGNTVFTTGVEEKD